MKSTKKILFVLVVIFFYSCKKDKTCWQGFQSGVDVQGMIICDKSQNELESTYPNIWFYNANEVKYCWKVQDAGGNIAYARNVPTSMANKMASTYGYNYTKIDCNSFCSWKIYEKHKSKLTGLYNPTRVYQETYVTDTCSKLYVGRIVVYRETADSLITREFVEKY